MATLTITDLAPGRTATLQLYQRGTNTTVGSLITGTSSGTTYSFAGVPSTGDYDAQLAGFSTPNGDRFPVRDAIAYVGLEWVEVDAIAPPLEVTRISVDTLEIIFGKANIRKWADLDNSKNLSDPAITERVEWALDWAYDHLKWQMAGSPELPVSSKVIDDVAARLAGIRLYEMRGISDEDASTSPIAHHRKFVSNWINAYKSGAVNSDTPAGPFVV